MGFFVHWAPASTAILCFDFPPRLKLSIQSTLSATQPKTTTCGPIHGGGNGTAPRDSFTMRQLGLVDTEPHISMGGGEHDSLPSIYTFLSELNRRTQRRARLQSPSRNRKTRYPRERDTVRGLKICPKPRGTVPKLQSHAETAAGNARQHSQPIFLFQVRLLEGLFARSKSNKARLQNETMLAFQAAAQRDSKTQVQIGEEAKKETAAMKAIASVFSTPFFFFGPGHESGDALAVSSQFWIYCAFTIPISLLTWGLWTVWDLSSRKKQVGMSRWSC
ncbi:hypothetical protein B0T14DRAFT_158155 [Immersiella caudata]|uniref:Uncharacterized protein n=1 Tax=Immersiella caudata TaxID=314043 RepID=A0AA39WWJ6_9PEZI|nr:hypothetical protein B0T14DRAFT_158155 [Immersiella caudata]